MASVNKCIFVGNLGKDPELRTFPDGGQVANIVIACTDKWKDKTTGEAKEATEWVRCTFNGRLAEIVGQYLFKGSSVYVEGSLRTRKWVDKDGVDKYATEINATSMQMLGSPKGFDGGQQAAPRQAAPQQRQAAPAPSRGAPARNAAPQRQTAPAGGPSGFDDFDNSDIPFITSGNLDLSLQMRNRHIQRVRKA